MRAPCRVLLIDDHPLFREGLRQAIEAAGGFRIAAEAATVAGAKTAADECEFDVAVVDLSLPDGSGIELVAWLRRRSADVPILVMSMHNSAEFVRNAFQNGATGYLTKGSSSSELSDALHTVSDGGVYAGAEVARFVLATGPRADEPADPLEALTTREREVAEELSRGLTAAEVGEKLGISVKTVEAHRGNIYRKLVVRNAVELTRLVARPPASPDLGVSP